MTLKQYNEKRETLLNEMQNLINEGKLEDATAKKTEIENLDNQFEQVKQAQADLNALKDGGVKVPEALAEPSTLNNGIDTKEDLSASSAAYRTAFLKNLQGNGDKMTKLENAAFVHNTTDTSAPLPTQMLDTIWDLVSGQHSIMGDVTIYRTGTIIEVVKHIEIEQGKAKKVTEGSANDDEKNKFDKVVLKGNDFSKHVDITYAMAKMSLDALEQYLINEIATGIGEAMAEDVVATIESGINSANKVNSAKAGEVAYKELAKLFGKLKHVKNVCVYATRATIFTHLVGMCDDNGRPIFQQSAQEGQAGYLLGAAIKVEDAVADNKILVGDPKKVVFNMIEDIMLEKEKDIKNHVYTYSGYARGEGALIDDKAFAELTVTE